MKKLLIIGAGGLGREAAWVVRRINELSPQWDLLGFIDDNEEKWGQLEDGYPVLGGCDKLPGYYAEDEIYLICTVGSARIRKKIIDKVGSLLESPRYATLIDPSAVISDRVKIGDGTLICAKVIITVDITLGMHDIVNLSCTIGHDSVIEDCVTLHPSVNVSGNSYLENTVEMGTGSQIIQGRRVGTNTVVGAGAVIINDIPANCTAVGVPAKPVKFFES